MEDLSANVSWQPKWVHVDVEHPPGAYGATPEGRKEFVWFSDDAWESVHD